MNKTQPKVYVVVLNFNGLEYTRECVEKLLDQDYGNFRVIVHDNGSRGKDAEELESIFNGRIRVSRSEENLGFTGGNNKVIREVLEKGDGDYVALINNDAYPERTWLKSLVSAAEREKDCGLFGSLTLFHDMPDTVENAGIDILSTLDAVPRGRGKKRGVFRDKAFIAGASASAALYRTAMLREIGLFREDFFANFEDVELSLRALSRGWKTLFVPDAVVYHRLNTTISEFFGDDFHARSLRNLLWAFLANVPAQVLILDLPWFLLRDILAVILSPLFLQPRIAKIIVKSRLMVVSELGTILKQRKEFKKKWSTPWPAFWRFQKNWVYHYLKFFVEALVLRKRSFLR